MTLTYKNIITLQDVKQIPKEKFEFINDAASIQTNILDRVNGDNKNNWIAKNCKCKNLDRQLFAEEQVFLKFHKDEDFTTKVLIVANAIYPKSDMMVNILLSYNITYELLNKILQRLENLKKLAIENETLANDKNINYICNRLRKYYPYNNCNFLIAKLVSIVTYEKELYLNLQGKQMIKTR